MEHCPCSLRPKYVVSGKKMKLPSSVISLWNDMDWKLGFSASGSKVKSCEPWTGPSCMRRLGLKSEGQIRLPGHSPTE